MACAQLRSEVIQIDVDAEHLICNVGDLVLVTHDVPMWGLAYGRVAGVSGTAITLDEAVPMETGGAYQIRFRLSDGTSVLRTVTTQAGLKTAITINSVVSGLAAGDLFMFGEAGSETRELIVQSISPGPDLTAKLQLVDHAPAVHTADTEEIPDYEPGVTVPPDIDLLRPPTPVIHSVVTDESVLERDVFGTLRSRILVNMRPPSLYSGPSPLFLESEFRATGDNRWIRLPILPAQSGNLSIYNVQDRQTYDIRVRYTSAGVAGDWATSNGVYVIGKTTPPPPPTQLWLDSGRVLRWAYGTEPPDFKGFEMRFSYGSSVTWETALHIHDGTLTGRTYTLPDTLRGTVTFEVRAVDVAGNYSTTGATLIKGLGDRPVDNIITTLDLRAAGWPGYKKNMEVWRSGTLAATGSSPYMYDADSGAMYDLDDSDPFYQCAFQEAAYTYIFQPGAGEIGATLSVQANISGGSWRVEYRKCHYLWPSDLDDDLWPTDLSDDFWPDEMSTWLPFHGELVLDDALYEIRMVFEPGTTHGRIEGLTLVFDVPDITEYLEDVVIHPGGTRLPITRQFNAIKAVTLTLQSTADYAGAVSVKVLDRNAAAGPLVKCFNTSGASVKAVIDATITGY